jgi:hypothetical protein
MIPQPITPYQNGAKEQEEVVNMLAHKQPGREVI